MTVPSPAPVPPYRGPLRILDGAPSLQELLVMGALLVGGLLLILAGWRLITGYIHGVWDGPMPPSRAQLLSAPLCLAAGGGLLWLLWIQLENVAARMGIGALVLAMLLADEVRPGSRRRRR